MPHLGHDLTAPDELQAAAISHPGTIILFVVGGGGGIMSRVQVQASLRGRLATANSFFSCTPTGLKEENCGSESKRSEARQGYIRDLGRLSGFSGCSFLRLFTYDSCR